MSNNEDLRIVKTKSAIKEAFYKLKAKKPANKIKVSELCELALINKSTFYKHYLDIEDLYASLQDDVLEKLIDGFAEKHLLFSDPEKFLTGLPLAIEKYEKEIQLLFKEDDYIFVFYKRCLRKLNELYNEKSRTPEQEIGISFVLSGALQTLSIMRFLKRYDEKTLVDSLSTLIRKLDLNQ